MATEHTLALIAANPFPGLRAFKPGESDRFFGRSQQIAELVARLAEVPLLAVSGASGCGKSSLVLAGLLAELRQRHADGDGTDWRPVVMRPGNRPIAHLAEPLARALFDDDEDERASLAGDEERQARSGALFGQLRLGGLGLVEAVRQSHLAQRSPRARVLVVVDQFEEVFRFKRMSDPDEASAFVKLLLAAAQDPASPVSVVITLRSDALGSCAEFRDLPEAVSRGGYLVPRLKRDQRKDAIVRPVEWRGTRIAPRLVQRLLNDVSDDFDDLPVMQHALSRIWQRWAEAGGGRPIDLEDYEAVGTAANALRRQAHDGAAGQAADTRALHGKDADDGQAANALARHANEALGSLGDKAGTAERVFRALTERVGDGTEVRRPLPFAQLVAVAGDGSETGAAAVREVVERYRRADTAFLLPGAEVSLDANPVIDISHESLIRQWDRLRDWVQAEAVAADELKGLLKITRERAQGRAEPLRGADLARTRDWLARNRPTPAWVQLVAGGDGAAQHRAVQDFIAASVAAEKQAQRRSRLQRLSWRAVLVLGVIGAFAFAFYSSREQRLAQARELTNQALLELPRDPAASAHLALAALDGDSGNRRADYALRQAMTALAVARPDAILALGAPLVEARFSAGQRWLLAAGGRTVWLIDPGAMTVKHTLDAEGEVLHAWLVGQGADERVVVQLRDQVRLLPLASGAAASAQALPCPGAQARRRIREVAVLDAVPVQIAVVCADGDLLLATLEAGALGSPRTLAAGDAARSLYGTLAFAADGAWLAAADLRGQIRVWKRGLDNRAWIGLGSAGGARLQHEGQINDIAFHPDDPSLLATAGDDRSARVWRLDLAGGRLAPNVGEQKAMEQLRHDRPVQRVRWVRRSDDAYKLMTVADKRVIFWSSSVDHDVRRHDDLVNDADVSADGELLVSASADGTAQVWSTRTITPMAVLRGHRNAVIGALFGPGGSVVSASADGSLRRWRTAPPTVLAADGLLPPRHADDPPVLGASARWQRSVAFSPRGDQVLICGERDLDDHHCRIAPVRDLGQRPDAQAEWLAGDPTLKGTGADEVAAGSWRHDGTQVLGPIAPLDLPRAAWPVLWDAATHRRITPAWLKQEQAARFNPARPELVTRGPDNAPAIWSADALAEAAPQALVRFAGHGGSPSLAPLPSPDGRWVATDDRNDVLLWDRLSPQAAPLRLTGHAGTVRGLAFSADSQALVSASSDRTARVWPLKGAAPGQPPQGVLLSGGHSAAVISAVFSPDGRYVATGGADNSVRVWDARHGWEISALHRHDNAVQALAWHADGRIASASDDGTVLLAPCQPCVAPLAGLREAARALPQTPPTIAAPATPR